MEDPKVEADSASREDLYWFTFEHSPDALFLVSKEARCMMANQAAGRLTGYPPEKLIGIGAEDIFAPEELDVRPVFEEEQVRAGRAFTSQRTFVRADGQRIPVEISLNPLPDGRSIAVVRDITERKGRDDALRAIVAGTSGHTGQPFFDKLVEQLATVLQVKHAFIGEFQGSPPSRVRTLSWWTEGRNLGSRVYELAGTPCEIVSRDQVCIHPDGIQELYPNDPMLGELGLRSYVGTVLRDSSGRPLGLLSVLDDRPLSEREPTESILRIFASRAGAELERLRNEAALSESETRQRALIEAFPDALFVMTTEGIYIDFHVHDLRRLRVPPSDFIGRSYRDVMPAELVPLFDRAFDSIRKGKTPKVFEYSSTSKRGPVHFEVRHADAGGGLVLAILRDITERKERESQIRRLTDDLERLVLERTSQLAAANLELESFAYSVSHDLRAPLRGIHSNASILREDLGGKATAAETESIERIIARANEMSSLIDGMLKISRIMRAELQKEPIDLSAMAEEAVENAVRWNSQRPAEVVVAPKVHASGDRVLLMAAIGNLIDNAVKFTSKNPNGRIEFGRETRDGEDVFFVRDNGVGFNMDHAGKLFRPFERLHGPTEFSGTGIGLATVHRIVGRHGGRIWAEGSPGAGATFYFTLGP